MATAYMILAFLRLMESRTWAWADLKKILAQAEFFVIQLRLGFNNSCP